MIKTITITDPMQVRIGDKAYFKHCDFGFDVISIRMIKSTPFAVINPLNGYRDWAESRQFAYAAREVDEPEWPAPQDNELHVYLGADGKRYIYNLCAERYTVPWSVEHSTEVLTQRQMAIVFPEALPLTELELVPKDHESGYRSPYMART